MRGKDPIADFYRSLEKGEFAPVYFLYGEDAREIDRALAAIKKAVLSEGMEEFNADFFQGRDQSADAVIAAAETLPVMAERRLVMVRHVEEFKKEERARLLEYLASPSRSTVLALAAPGLSEKSLKKEDQELKKAAEKTGLALHFSPPSPKALPQLLMEAAKRKGKTMDRAAAELFLSLAGENLMNLEQELEKLALFTGDKKKLSEDDVMAAVADLKETSVFELTDAVSARDPEAALRAFHRLRAQGQEPLMLLGMLARHFRLLLRMRELRDRGESPGQIARKMNMPEWRFRNNYLPYLGRFSPGEAGSIVRELAELDLKLKSTRGDRDLLFERALSRLCRGRLG